MSAVMSWFVSVIAVLGLVIMLHHLGINLTADVGPTLRSTVHLLAQPLFVP